MSEKHLTRKEAIKKGYEYFVYPADGYQSVKSLTEFEEDEINFDAKPMLCEKQSFHPRGLTDIELKNLIIEQIWDDHCSDIGDDTDNVPDALSDLDCSDLAFEIKKRLDTLNYWRQSDVHLVCNDR